MSTQTMESENKTLLRRWFEEVWSLAQHEAIDQLRTPDATATGLAESSAQIQDAHQLKAFVAKMRGALPDLRVSI